MKLWIARYENEEIALFISEPYKRYSEGITYWTIDKPIGNYIYLPQKSFPEITFENSPQEVELKLIENGE